MNGRLTIRCESHGQLHEADVACQHDVEYELRRVVDAHHAPYGGNCQGPLHVDVADESGLVTSSSHKRIPGES